MFYKTYLIKTSSYIIKTKRVIQYILAAKNINSRPTVISKDGRKTNPYSSIGLYVNGLFLS